MHLFVELVDASQDAEFSHQSHLTDTPPSEVLVQIWCSSEAEVHFALDRILGYNAVHLVD